MYPYCITRYRYNNDQKQLFITVILTGQFVLGKAQSLTVQADTVYVVASRDWPFTRQVANIDSNLSAPHQWMAIPAISALNAVSINGLATLSNRVCHPDTQLSYLKAYLSTVLQRVYMMPPYPNIVFQLQQIVERRAATTTVIIPWGVVCCCHTNPYLAIIWKQLCILLHPIIPLQCSPYKGIHQSWAGVCPGRKMITKCYFISTKWTHPQKVINLKKR